MQAFSNTPTSIENKEESSKFLGINWAHFSDFFGHLRDHQRQKEGIKNRFNHLIYHDF
jgi:hypothetical protein